MRSKLGIKKENLYSRQHPYAQNTISDDMATSSASSFVRKDSHQNQFSLNNIDTYSREQMVRFNKMIVEEKMF